MKRLSITACALLISAMVQAQAASHGLRMTIFPNSGLPGESILAEFELNQEFPLDGMVQFSVDGQAIGREQPMLDGAARISMPSMRHGSHRLSAEYTTAGGAETGVVEARILVNTPPILPRFGLGVSQGKAASFSVSALLKEIRDNDGDQVSLQFDATSQSGARVSKLGDFVTYTPSLGTAGRDLIRYRAVDAYGATTSGVVEVNVKTIDPGPQITIAAGKLVLTAPLGMSLAVQTSKDLKDWTTLQSFDGSTKIAQVDNWNCTDHPDHFYRTIPLSSELPTAKPVILTASLGQN